MKHWHNELKTIVGSSLQENVDLTFKSSLRTGGRCEFYLELENSETLIEIFRLKEKYSFPIHFLGRGSNVLINDDLISGVVVQPRSEQSKYSVTNNTIELDASIYLPQAIKLCHENNLIGFEFAAGIPGTIGGSIKMNAGTKTGDISSVVHSVTCVTSKGVVEVPRKNINFGYRKSSVLSDQYITKGTFILKKGTDEEIDQQKQNIKQYLDYRNNTQPLNHPSLGSTFVNPANDFAARLIESAGLKGFAIGGIQVSEKHANFIINTGKGTAKDAIELLEKIESMVKEKFGIALTREIVLFGF